MFHIAVFMYGAMFGVEPGSFHTRAECLVALEEKLAKSPSIQQHVKEGKMDVQCVDQIELKLLQSINDSY